jgi:hypothetical protein
MKQAAWLLERPQKRGLQLAPRMPHDSTSSPCPQLCTSTRQAVLFLGMESFWLDMGACSHL